MRNKIERIWIYYDTNAAGEPFVHASIEPNDRFDEYVLASQWPDKNSVEKTIKKYTQFLFEMGDVTKDRVEAAMWALHDTLKAKGGKNDPTN